MSSIDKYYKTARQLDYEKRRDEHDRQIERYYNGEISLKQMNHNQYKAMGWTEREIKENGWGMHER